MNKLKIFFSDFWSTFEENNNLFFNLLKTKYSIEITDKNPDLVFFSIFGSNHIKFNTKKIFFTGENILPDFYDFDYAMSFQYIENNNYYRLPLYALFNDVYKLLNKPNPEYILNSKSKFCNFIYSNPICKIRNDFFKKLNKYKRVDAAGRVLNNTGYLVKDKLSYIKDYKFTIAFENESDIGYTTEKIFEPMLVNSMPIYWGNELVHNDFNVDSFVFANNFNNLDDLVDYIIELDQNDDKYLEKVNEPYFLNNEVNSFVENKNILEFLDMVINDSNELKVNHFFDKNNNLSEINRLKLKTHSDLRMLKLKTKFFTYKKTIMRLKTKNLSFE